MHGTWGGHVLSAAWGIDDFAFVADDGGAENPRESLVFARPLTQKHRAHTDDHPYGYVAAVALDAAVTRMAEKYPSRVEKYRRWAREERQVAHVRAVLRQEQRAKVAAS